MTSNPQFSAQTNGSEVVAAFSAEVKGKIILITGVSINGLGGETALTIASQAPRLLILAGRDLSKVGAVIAKIENLYPSVETRPLQLDLSSISAVESAAAKVKGYPENHIDVLINNAGVMNLPTRTLNAAGIEQHLATNHLGPFLLTKLLTPKLVAAPAGARVVNVSSNSHTLTPFRFSDWNFEGKDADLLDDEKPNMAMIANFVIPFTPGYVPAIAYGQSKTANVLHAREISKRLGDRGVIAFSLHPGAIATELWRFFDPAETDAYFESLPMKDLSQGVSTTLVAAFDPKLQASPGAYLEDCQIGAAAKHAKSEEAAERLWDLSERLTHT